MDNSILLGRSARNARRLAALREAVSVLQGELHQYAEMHGGAFIITGAPVVSEADFACGFKISPDFANDDEHEAALAFARRACLARGVTPEVVG